jgi:hypothetical protein
MKKDPLQVKVSSTSAYFGVRGIVRGVSRILGLPRPLSSALAAVIGSLLSESAKARGRSDFRGSNSRNISEISLSNAIGEDSIDAAEISGDVSKWVIYDSLSELSSDSDLFREDAVGEQLSCSVYGAASSLAGLFVTKVLNDKFASASSARTRVSKPVTPSLFKFAAAEGAVLFGSYHLVSEILKEIFPKELNFQFQFNQIIERVEEKLEVDSQLRVTER